MDLVDVRAIGLDMGTIIDLVIGVYQPHAGRPVPDLLGIFGICLIISVPGEPGTEVEEAAVCNGVLVVIPTEERVNLPPQAIGVSILQRF